MLPYQEPLSESAEEHRREGPTKLSLRYLDDGEAASREEDLEHGPLLLQLGATLDEDDNVISPQSKLHLDDDDGGSVQTSTPHPQISLGPDRPFIPIGGPSTSYNETVTRSESSNGRSFTVPTESISLAAGVNMLAMDTAILHLYGGSDGHLNRPFFLDETAFDEYTKNPTGLPSQSDDRTIFPWNIEFEWTDDCLYLAGEPMDIRSPTSHSSEVADIGLDTRSWTETCVSTVDTDRPPEHILSAASDTVVGILVDELREYFLRACPADRQSKKSRTEDVRQHSSGRGAHGGTRYTPLPRRSAPSNRRKISQDNGSGGDDSDEGEISKGKKHAKNVERLFRCPFAAWNPGHFKECNTYSMRKVWQVKKHLREKHQKPYCPRCRMDSTQNHEFCIPERNREVYFMTSDKSERINQYPDRNSTHEQQWEHIWHILFPGDTPPLSPYLDERLVRVIERLEAGRPEARKIAMAKWKEISSDCLYSKLDASEHFGMAWDVGISEFLERYLYQISAGSPSSSETVDYSGTTPADNLASYVEVEGGDFEMDSYNAPEGSQAQLQQSTLSDITPLTEVSRPMSVYLQPPQATGLLRTTGNETCFFPNEGTTADIDEYGESGLSNVGAVESLSPFDMFTWLDEFQNADRSGWL